MKTTIEYWMKGEPKACRTFDTYPAAIKFMKSLAENPDCEAYGIDSTYLEPRKQLLEA